MYSDIEPYDQGLLAVGDGNSIYWECCGNPKGTPAVYLHGGPGSGCTPGARRFFDPEAYRIVLFDQRGCGRSRSLLSKPLAQGLPHAGPHPASRGDPQPSRSIVGNARRLLGHHVSTCCHASLSWHVAALVLASVTTTSRRDVEWLTVDVGRIFPPQWERLASHIPTSMKDMRIVDAYASLLFDDDPSVSAAAAAEWCAWERAISR